MATVHYRQNKWQLFIFRGGGGVARDIQWQLQRRGYADLQSPKSTQGLTQVGVGARGGGGGITQTFTLQICTSLRMFTKHNGSFILHRTRNGTGTGNNEFLYIMLCCSHCTGTRTGNGKIVNGFWTYFSIPEMVPAWTCKHAMHP